MKLDIRVHVMKVGGIYVAATQLGGINMRGARASSPPQAVRNLFFAIGEGSSDDHQIGLELAIEGTTLEAAMAELPTGEGQQ